VKVAIVRIEIRCSHIESLCTHHHRHYRIPQIEINILSDYLELGAPKRSEFPAFLALNQETMMSRQHSQLEFVVGLVIKGQQRLSILLCNCYFKYLIFEEFMFFEGRSQAELLEFMAFFGQRLKIVFDVGVVGDQLRGWLWLTVEVIRCFAEFSRCRLGIEVEASIAESLVGLICAHFML
jgi:hypothetical protein